MHDVFIGRVRSEKVADRAKAESSQVSMFCAVFLLNRLALKIVRAALHLLHPICSMSLAVNEHLVHKS